MAVRLELSGPDAQIASPGGSTSGNDDFLSRICNPEFILSRPTDIPELVNDLLLLGTRGCSVKSMLVMLARSSPPRPPIIRNREFRMTSKVLAYALGMMRFTAT